MTGESDRGVKARKLAATSQTEPERTPKPARCMINLAASLINVPDRFIDRSRCVIDVADCIINAS